MRLIPALALCLATLSTMMTTDTPPASTQPQLLTPSPNGPTVLCRGEDYAIFAFRGMVDIPGIMYTEAPGLVFLHANLKTGMPKWIFRSGTFARPTRRISFRVIRVVGVIQTETEVAVAYFDSRFVFDSPRIEPMPPGASYSVLVFRKTDGVSREIKLEFPEGLPSPVPEETIEGGVFKKGENGFSVFGREFAIRPGGSIEEKTAEVK